MKEINVKVFVGITCAVLYAVLCIGDFIKISTGMDGNWFRYILVGISSIIVTFILVLSNAKKSGNMDMDDITKRFIIAPLIISAIIFVYGIYSVYSNWDKIKNTSIYSVYSSMFKNQISEIENSAVLEAIINWGKTALIYLVTSEGVLYFMKKKVNFSIDDHSANLVDTVNMQNDVVNSVEQGGINQNNINYGGTNQVENSNSQIQNQKDQWGL